MKNIIGKESGEPGWNAIWEKKRQVKGCARRLKFIRGLVKQRKKLDYREEKQELTEGCEKAE